MNRRWLHPAVVWNESEMLTVPSADIGADRHELRVVIRAELRRDLVRRRRADQQRNRRQVAGRGAVGRLVVLVVDRRVRVAVVALAERGRQQLLGSAAAARACGRSGSRCRS